MSSSFYKNPTSWNQNKASHKQNIFDRNGGSIYNFYQNQEAEQNPLNIPAIIKLNLRSFNELQNSKSQHYQNRLFRYIELCVEVISISPSLTVTDGTFTMNITSQVQISPKYINQYVILMLGRAQNNSLHVVFIRQILPGERQLFQLNLNYSQKLTQKLSNKQNVVTIKKPKLAQAHIIQLIQTTMKQRQFFTMQQLIQQLKDTSSQTIKDVIDLFQNEGKIANLGAQFYWSNEQ